MLMTDAAPLRILHRTLETVKNTLEYLHLTEFLLHVSQSEVMSLLLVAVTSSPGWTIFSAMAVVGLMWTRGRDEGKRARADTEAPSGAVVTKQEHRELATVVADVPRALRDFVGQGVSVRIVIELTPEPRRRPGGRPRRGRHRK